MIIRFIALMSFCISTCWGMEESGEGEIKLPLNTGNSHAKVGKIIQKIEESGSFKGTWDCEGCSGAEICEVLEWLKEKDQIRRRKYLSFSRTNIDDKGLKLLSYWENLELCFLNNCPHITGKGVLENLTSLKKIRVLSVKGSIGISSEDVDEFVKKVPQCKVVSTQEKSDRPSEGWLSGLEKWKKHAEERKAIVGERPNSAPKLGEICLILKKKESPIEGENDNVKSPQEKTNLDWIEKYPNWIDSLDHEIEKEFCHYLFSLSKTNYEEMDSLSIYFIEKRLQYFENFPEVKDILVKSLVSPIIFFKYPWGSLVRGEISRFIGSPKVKEYRETREKLRRLLLILFEKTAPEGSSSDTSSKS